MLDQAETDIDPLLRSGQPDQVATAFVFLLRLLASSSSRLQVGMGLGQHDQLSARQPVTGHKVDKTAESLSTSAHFLSTPEIP